MAELASQFLHQLMRNGSAEFGMEATRGIPFRVRECFHGADNRRTFHSVLLPCNICETLLFPTTPPPSRNLHPRTTHTHRCAHIHIQPQYPLPLFWCTTWTTSGEAANNGWHISRFWRSIIQSDLNGGNEWTRASRPTEPNMLFLRISARRSNSSESVALHESLVQMGPTKTNTNTDSWDNTLIHQAIRAHAGWGYLESSLILFLTNYEQAGSSCLLSKPLLHVEWMIFAINKRGIHHILLNLFSVQCKSSIVSSQWPAFGFLDIIFPSE